MDQTDPKTQFQIRSINTPLDLLAARKLFIAYASSLRISLSFQNFAEELESLPGPYAPPKGAVFLALSLENVPIGCVALRPLPSAGRICEMKRLYCTPEARGLGVGKALVEQVLREAERLDYEEMRLDTLPDMVGARSIYQRIGFQEIEAYYQTPLKTTIFLAKKLRTREVE